MRRLHSLLTELLVGSNSLVAGGWLKRFGPAGECFNHDDLMGQLCPVHSVTTCRYPPPELQRILCGTELEGANACSVPNAVLSKKWQQPFAANPGIREAAIRYHRPRSFWCSRRHIPPRNARKLIGRKVATGRGVLAGQWALLQTVRVPRCRLPYPCQKSKAGDSGSGRASI
jgi:hypothetical protein